MEHLQNILGNVKLKLTFIGEIFLEDFRKKGKTSTLHLDINKLDYIEDAVNHLQNTGVWGGGREAWRGQSGVLLHLFSTRNVLGGNLKNQSNHGSRRSNLCCKLCRLCTLGAVDRIPNLINARPCIRGRDRRGLSGWIDLEFSSTEYPFATIRTNKQFSLFFLSQ